MATQQVRRLLVAGAIMAAVLSTSLGGLTATPAAAQSPGTIPRGSSQTVVAEPTPAPQRQMTDPWHFWCKPGGPAHNMPICSTYTYPHPDYP